MSNVQPMGDHDWQFRSPDTAQEVQSRKPKHIDSGTIVTELDRNASLIFFRPQNGTEHYHMPIAEFRNCATHRDDLKKPTSAT